MMIGPQHLLGRDTDVPDPTPGAVTPQPPARDTSWVPSLYENSPVASFAVALLRARYPRLFAGLSAVTTTPAVEDPLELDHLGELS